VRSAEPPLQLRHNVDCISLERAERLGERHVAELVLADQPCLRLSLRYAG
jgi:hypothetical protein